MRWGNEKHIQVSFWLEQGNKGFSGGSEGKESACNVGDPGSIPGKIPLVKEMATHSSMLAWRIPRDKGAW